LVQLDLRRAHGDWLAGHRPLLVARARADLGLDATKVWFSETHHWGVIVGCTLFYIAAGILTPGSIAFGIMLAKIEGRWRLWSFTTAVCGVFIF